MDLTPMSDRILVFYGSYRSDRMGIRLAEYAVRTLNARGAQAELIDANRGHGRNVWQREWNDALEVIGQIKEIMLSSVRRTP